MYIIDFKRINELTSHPVDASKNENVYASNPVLSISKGIIKQYLDIYLNKTYSTDEMKEIIIETLVYNKILITKTDIRESKLKKLIDK